MATNNGATAAGELDWAMIGGIIGGAVCLLLIMALALGVLIGRRRRNSDDEDESRGKSEPMEPPATATIPGDLRANSNVYASVDAMRKDTVTYYGGMVVAPAPGEGQASNPNYGGVADVNVNPAAAAIAIAYDTWENRVNNSNDQSDA